MAVTLSGRYEILTNDSELILSVPEEWVNKDKLDHLEFEKTTADNSILKFDMPDKTDKEGQKAALAKIADALMEIELVSGSETKGKIADNKTLRTVFGKNYKTLIEKEVKEKRDHIKSKEDVELPTLNEDSPHALAKKDRDNVFLSIKKAIISGKISEDSIDNVQHNLEHYMDTETRRASHRNQVFTNKQVKELEALLSKYPHNSGLNKFFQEMKGLHNLQNINDSRLVYAEVKGKEANFKVSTNGLSLDDKKDLLKILADEDKGFNFEYDSSSNTLQYKASGITEVNKVTDFLDSLSKGKNKKVKFNSSDHIREKLGKESNLADRGGIDVSTSSSPIVALEEIKTNPKTKEKKLAAMDGSAMVDAALTNNLRKIVITGGLIALSAATGVGFGFVGLMVLRTAADMAKTAFETKAKVQGYDIKESNGATICGIVGKVAMIASIACAVASISDIIVNSQEHWNLAKTFSKETLLAGVKKGAVWIERLAIGGTIAAAATHIVAPLAINKWSNKVAVSTAPSGRTP